LRKIENSRKAELLSLSLSKKKKRKIDERQKIIDRFQVGLQTVNCFISRKANKKEILGGKIKALDVCYKFIIRIFALKSFCIF